MSGRRIGTFLALMILVGTHARAQFLGGSYSWIAPGSTAEGDYLRGLGIAAQGIGFLELSNAQATSINLDSWIRLDLYIGAVADYEARMHAARLQANAQRAKENHAKIQQRLKENPEARDVDNGSALNSLLEELNAGKYQDSAQGFIDVPMPVDVIRQIPFKLPEKGVKSFSIQRLTAKGRSKWPVGMQDDRLFAYERKAYEEALDQVLEQHVAGRVEKSSIDRLDATVKDLQSKLERVYPPTDKRSVDGRERIRQLQDTVEMLRWTKIQLALTELDHYAGQTVNDLRIFMRKHNLQFSSGSTPEERKLMPQVFEQLKTHQLRLIEAPSQAAK